MALVKCPECGREGVSDSANACPQCGFNVEKHFQSKKYDEQISNTNNEITKNNEPEIDEDKMYVCSKCGNIISEMPYKDIRCSCCNHFMTETQYSSNEYTHNSDLGEIILQEYCDNPDSYNSKNLTNEVLPNDGESTDLYKSSTTIAQPRNRTKTLVLILIFLLMIWGYISCASSFPHSNNSKTSSVHTTECEWCGKYKECSKYQVQILDGFHKDGSFKFKYEVVWLDDDCYEKAKDKGIYYNWVNITKLES